MSSVSVKHKCRGNERDGSSSSSYSYSRYLSLPTLEKAQTAIKWNFVISNCLMLMAGWLGMVMYSVYRDCDPISAKQVTICNAES